MAANTVHQLKVTLRGVKPPVWRRIVVRSDLSLGELAQILEGAMGWLGGHLHAFDIDGTWYGTLDPDWPSDDLDENEYRLGEVLPSVGDKMRWDYDFGDGWEHSVQVERIVEAEPSVEYPACLAGRRACPPEDCGGPHGYAQLLEVLADRSHPEHEELREWAPIDFDPDYFDVEEASLAMRSLVRWKVGRHLRSEDGWLSINRHLGRRGGSASNPPDCRIPLIGCRYHRAPQAPQAGS